MIALEHDYDLLVVGTGAGCAGAIRAADLGLRTLVIEKTDLVAVVPPPRRRDLGALATTTCSAW